MLTDMNDTDIVKAAASIEQRQKKQNKTLKRFQPLTKSKSTPSGENGERILFLKHEGRARKDQKLRANRHI